MAEDLSTKLLYMGIRTVFYQDAYRQTVGVRNLGREDVALAMSLLILLVNVLARGLYEILVHRIKLRGRRQADRS